MLVTCVESNQSVTRYDVGGYTPLKEAAGAGWGVGKPGTPDGHFLSGDCSKKSGGFVLIGCSFSIESVPGSEVGTLGSNDDGGWGIEVNDPLVSGFTSTITAADTSSDAYVEIHQKAGPSRMLGSVIGGCRLMGFSIFKGAVTWYDVGGPTPTGSAADVGSDGGTVWFGASVILGGC